MHEIGIAGAVRRLDLHFRFGHRDRIRCARQQERHAGAKRERAELAAADRATRRVFLQVVFKMVLIAHDLPPVVVSIASRKKGSGIFFETRHHPCVVFGKAGRFGCQDAFGMRYRALFSTS
jgi:hypothetical protein